MINWIIDSRFIISIDQNELVIFQIFKDNESQKNIHLFTGPSGSGKSSLLSKLAVDLGTKVIFMKRWLVKPFMYYDP